MGTDIILAGAMQAVATASAAVISTYKIRGVARKAELEAVRLAAAEALALKRMQGNSSLIVANLEAIVALLRRIEREELTGKAFEIAMRQLDLLADQNGRLITAYGRL